MWNNYFLLDKMQTLDWYRDGGGGVTLYVDEKETETETEDSVRQRQRIV